VSEITGRFGDSTGRPYIEARLVLPRLRFQMDISLLVDTGADTTVLMPDDGVGAGLDYAELSGAHEIVGLGGTMDTFVEPGIILFSVPGKRLYGYDINLCIFPGGYQRTPSLLGRDVLACWKMLSAPAENRLSFKVVTADYVIDLRSETPIDL